MYITLEEERLSLALQNLLACKHLHSSPLRHAPSYLITLLLEQFMRNREINLHQTPLEDGSYASDVLLQLSRTCPHIKRVVGCWLDTKKNIKWGGPLCGFFDPDRTTFIVDLNVLKSVKLWKKFSAFDKTLFASSIKSWACLKWCPLTTWFNEVFFEEMSVAKWSDTREQWKNPAFQAFAKHIRIDMSRVPLSSPTILLDAVFSYLGPKHRIETLDIKVHATAKDPWPTVQISTDPKIQQIHPVVPIFAVVWKWQEMCDLWDEEYGARMSCTCCWRRRPQIRFWNVAKGGHNSWVPLELSTDYGYFDYQAVQWTCAERRYWEWTRSNMHEGSWCSWFEFYDCSITNMETANICTLLDNFLVDIGAA